MHDIIKFELADVSALLNSRRTHRPSGHRLKIYMLDEQKGSLLAPYPFTQACIHVVGLCVCVFSSPL